MLLRKAYVIVVLTFLFTISAVMPISAQNNGTDVVFHKFHPKQAPGVVAARVTPARTFAANERGLSESVVAQISALQQEKQSRTWLQKKIDSNVLYTSRMLRNQPVANGIQTLETDIDLDQNDNIVVDMVADVSEDLLRQMQGLGVRVVQSNASYRSVRATIPAAQLEAVAGLPGVIWIGAKPEAMTSGMPAVTHAVSQSRGGGLEAFLRSALVLKTPFMQMQTFAPITNVFGSGQGSKASEGDVAHRTADARNTFGITGAGVKIGVLSDGVTSLAASQALGDLGPVTVLPGQTGSGDEGTAMLEIIHDLAPGAQLYFATAFNGPAGFAQNIRSLRAAGCDIIVDDVGYSTETPFQDGQAASVTSNTSGGVIAQAVNDVSTDGAMYFSSAGNAGNMDDGTAGVWEGDFVNGGTTTLTGTSTVHQFGSNLYNTITKAGNWISLFWADPLGGPAADYDLYVLDSTGANIVAQSTNAQGAAGADPYEFVGSSYNRVNNRIVVAKYNGPDRYIHVNTNRGSLAVATTGQTHGHSTASKGFGVAATPAATPASSAYPMGPYPGYFTSTNVVEYFSSDGPRRIFFNADGTSITPGNYSATGGTVLQKPDFTAADGVAVTGSGGFPNPFYGTSAASPHAAAIAALVKSAKAGLTNEQIKTALVSTAIDIMSLGTDRTSGAGILDAFAAVRSLGVPGMANPDIASVMAAENPGNRNGVLEGGEGGVLTVQLQNLAGLVDATNITATLTSTTPGVIITQPNTTAYANLGALTGTGTNQTPLTFTLASDFLCGTPIQFTLDLAYTGGPSPRAFKFTVPTDYIVSTVLDNTAPAVSAPFSGVTGTQTGRVARAGGPSYCGAVKSYPGLTTTTGTRQFDAVNFTACRSGCATITTTSPDGVKLFTLAYTPGFDPTSLGNGYAGDAGGSGSTTSFGIDVQSGTSYSVVVHEVNPGQGIGTSYALGVSGCAVNCGVPNRLPVAKVKDVTVTVGSNGTAAASIDDGSSDPDGDTLTVTQTPASPYGIGTRPVLLTVVDTKGATAQSTATVTVQDVPVTLTAAGGTWASGVSLTKTLGTITHTVGVASDLTASISWGDGTATSTGAVTGTAPSFSVSGTHTYATTGTYTVTVSVQDIHGGTASQTTSWTVANPDFGFTGSIGTTTVLAGRQGGTSITITPNPAPYNSAITLSCTGAPEHATCGVNPSSITPGANPTTVTLTVTTSGPHSGGQSSLTRGGVVYASLMLGGLGVIGLFGIGRVRSGRKGRTLVVVALLAIAAMSLASCGGGGGTTNQVTTPAGTYTLTVTATSGTLSHSTTATLVVQQ